MLLFRSHRAFFLLFAISSACAAPPPAPRSSTPSPEVEYNGCEAVLMPGPLCVLGPHRKLQIWIEAPPDAGIEIQVDGRRIDAAAQPVRDGQRFALILPPLAKRVDVLVASQEKPWSLALAAPNGTARDLLRETYTNLDAVRLDIANRRLAAARKGLQAIRLPSRAPADARYAVSYYRGLLAAKEGDYRTALTEIQEAVEIAERVKHERFLWLAEEKLALLLRELGRSREAAHLFERLRQTPHAWDSCEEAQLLGNQAWAVLLAREAGEGFGDPTPLLESALATYETCDDIKTENRVNLLINLALAHLQERRLAQAKKYLARACSLDPDPPLHFTLWLTDLEARIALQEGRPAEALRRFEDLAEIAAAASSFDGRLRAALGKARSQEALGDRAGALETLREAEALLDEQSLQVPLHGGRETFMAMRQAIVSLHLELLLQQGSNAEALSVARHARSRMLRQLEQGDRLAGLSAEQRARWVSLMTEYQVRRAALDARAKDERTLPGNQFRHVEAVRKAETAGVKEILDQAFLVFGKERPREPPPPPRPGELILAYHPLSRGWAGFAADGQTVAARRIELPADVLSLSGKELARRLLLPFRGAIRKAGRIRILASGQLLGVDFHMLPFEDDVLLARAPVVYGLDLPVSSVDGAHAPGRHALLVADPRENLPGALDEVRSVRKVLESRSWTTEELRGEEASAEAVRERLAAADLLHYAGHGTFSGFGGWDSSLLLAEETQLTLGDLLALDRVPAWAVLSACDTGRSSTDVPIESLGLAHAFLLAGSRAVVASIRPADDRKLAAFFPELYRQWDREPDLAVALQHAQLSWRKRHPGEDPESFRVFEP